MAKDAIPVIATIIILVYMAIRYYKLGILKTIAETIGILILAQALLLSIMAITRIPVGRVTIPLVIAIYILTLLGITSYFEKKNSTDFINNIYFIIHVDDCN